MLKVLHGSTDKINNFYFKECGAAEMTQFAFKPVKQLKNSLLTFSAKINIFSLNSNKHSTIFKRLKQKPPRTF